MLAKRGARGHSFSRLGDYLTNGTLQEKAFNQAAGVPDGQRVAFVVTGNMLMNDADYARADPAEQRAAYVELIEKASKVMAWTAMHNEELKELAGESNRGRKSTEPVLHYALSWKSGEPQDDAHMVEFAKHVIEKLGLGGREYMIVGHNDTDHRHLHIVANAVDPLTGKSIKSTFDKLDLSKLALDYEREHGVQCALRVDNWEARDRGEHVFYKAAEVYDFAAYRARRDERHKAAADLAAERKKATELAEKEKERAERDARIKADRESGEDYRHKEPEWQPTEADYFLRKLETEYGPEKVSRLPGWMLNPANETRVLAILDYEQRREVRTRKHEERMAWLDAKAEARRETVKEEFTLKEATPARHALDDQQADIKAGFKHRQEIETDAHKAVMGRMFDEPMAQDKARLDEIRALLAQKGPAGMVARTLAGGHEALRAEIADLRASYLDGQAKRALAEGTLERAQSAERDALEAKHTQQRDQMEAQLKARLERRLQGSEAYYTNLRDQEQRKFETRDALARKEFEARMLNEHGLKTVYSMHTGDRDFVQARQADVVQEAKQVQQAAQMRESFRESGEGKAQGSGSGDREQSSFSPAPESANDNGAEQDRDQDLGLGLGLGLGR